MGQDRISGIAANKWGHMMAAKVAQHLGIELLSHDSNEASFNGKRIIIKSAHHKTPEIGISKKTLDRVDAIIAALETEKGDYALYEITPKWFSKQMKPSRSKSPSAAKVMMVSCKAVINAGQFLGSMTISTNPQKSQVGLESKEGPSAIPIDNKIIDKIKETIKIALEYEAATCGKRKLGITAEIGEVLACYQLGLKLVLDARSKGFDAIDKDGLLVQIKSRRSESEGMPRDAGRVGTFSKHPFDYALLILLDNNYQLCEIWRAEYGTLKPLIEKQKRRNPNLSSFKRTAKKYSKSNGVNPKRANLSELLGRIIGTDQKVLARENRRNTR